MKRVFFRFAIVALLALSVTLIGCGNEPIDCVPEFTEKESITIPEKPDVDVYCDASLSMAGYTVIPTGNFYRELPDELMDIGSSMGNDGKVTFYRFGNTVAQLKGSEYRQFINPAPYTELENSIKSVIDNASPERLSIVLTDLYETDAAWSAISTKIQDKYFKNKCAVAVVGFQTPFSGTIYDVGLDHAKFDYSGNRPVYMLVMGPNEHVNSFLKRCVEKKIAGGNINIAKLSGCLQADKTADVTTMLEGEVQNVAEDDSLDLPKEAKAVEYKISSIDDEVVITRMFKYVPDQFGCQLDFNKIKKIVQIQYFNDEEKTWATREATGIKVDVVKNEEEAGTYNVIVSFNPKDGLEQDTVNGVRVMLVPEYDGLILPEWVSQWNLPAGIASGGGFDGTKTVNLARTIGSLKDSVLSVSQPSLINLVMYFDLR